MPVKRGRDNRGTTVLSERGLLVLLRAALPHVAQQCDQLLNWLQADKKLKILNKTNRKLF